MEQQDKQKAKTGEVRPFDALVMPHDENGTGGLPNEIYLQSGGLLENKTLDITWCKQRVNDDDTKYLKMESIIPSDNDEKQAFFIANIRSQMSEDEIIFLSKYLVAAHCKNIGKFVQHVQQIRDAV